MIYLRERELTSPTIRGARLGSGARAREFPVQIGIQAAGKLMERAVIRGRLGRTFIARILSCYTTNAEMLDLMGRARWELQFLSGEEQGRYRLESQAVSAG